MAVALLMKRRSSNTSFSKNNFHNKPSQDERRKKVYTGCYTCGKTDHIRKDCVGCHVCGLKGHLSRNCYKKSGNFRTRNNGGVYTVQQTATSTQKQAFVGSSKEFINNDVRLIDSGATDHMTHRRDFFSVFEEFEEPITIRLGNGELTPAYGKDTPTAEYYKTIETNVIAPTICAREFLQSIKKRNTCGHIVNINSIAGHFAEAIHVPVGMYAASKYAVTALCSELRHEIIAANLNVKVTSISPGLVRTEMVQDFIANLDVRTLEPEDIADSAIYAIGTPERVEIHEITIIPHGTPIVDLNSSLQTKQ
nr:PREDICTED: dehydrogenase/reductase SDR family member 11-like isoform X5 [Megachile rotundata]